MFLHCMVATVMSKNEHIPGKVAYLKLRYGSYVDFLGLKRSDHHNNSHHLDT